MASVKTHLRVAATALIGLAIVLGLTTACQRTTEGTVAQTTEPGPPLPSAPTTTSGRPGIPGLPEIPGIPIPNIPLPTRNTNVPEVPAPPNATSMTCGEYNDLDEATRVAVVREILARWDPTASSSARSWPTRPASSCPAPGSARS